jgi:hypothetical protein
MALRPARVSGAMDRRRSDERLGDEYRVEDGW